MGGDRRDTDLTPEQFRLNFTVSTSPDRADSNNTTRLRVLLQYSRYRIALSPNLESLVAEADFKASARVCILPAFGPQPQPSGILLFWRKLA